MVLLGMNHQGTSRAPLVKASLNTRILCVLQQIDDNVLKDLNKKTKNKQTTKKPKQTNKQKTRKAENVCLQ